MPNALARARARSPLKTALVILAVALAAGVGLWLFDEDHRGFLNIRLASPAAAAPDAGEGVGAEVAQYAEAVMNGRTADERLAAATGIIPDPLAETRRQRQDPHSRLREAFDAGKEAMAVGRDRDAVPYFQEAIRLDPQFAEAHYRLGLAYVRMGRVKDARRERATLEKMDPDLARLLANLVNQ